MLLPEKGSGRASRKVGQEPMETQRNFRQKTHPKKNAFDYGRRLRKDGASLCSSIRGVTTKKIRFGRHSLLSFSGKCRESDFCCGGGGAVRSCSSRTTVGKKAGLKLRGCWWFGSSWPSLLSACLSKSSCINRDGLKTCWPRYPKD